MPRLLSAKERDIVQKLVDADEEEMYGLQFVSDSDGGLKRGSIYVLLGRMQAKGYIESRLDTKTPPQGGLPLRLYKVTPYGKAVFEATKAYNAAIEAVSPGFPSETAKVIR